MCRSEWRADPPPFVERAADFPVRGGRLGTVPAAGDWNEVMMWSWEGGQQPVCVCVCVCVCV